MATMGTLQSRGDTFRGGQHLTEVVPNECVTLLGRTVACLTAMVMRRVNRLGRAATHIGAMAMRGRAGTIGRRTRSTADSRPQEVVMGCVIARRLAFIERQLSLDPGEGVLGNEWRNGRHQGPCFR